MVSIVYDDNYKMLDERIVLEYNRINRDLDGFGSFLHAVKSLQKDYNGIVHIILCISKNTGYVSRHIEIETDDEKTKKMVEGLMNQYLGVANVCLPSEIPQLLANALPSI